MQDPISHPPQQSAAHVANARAWDAYARNQQRFAKPVTDKQFAERLDAISGDPWLGGGLKHARVLCLGSGGGMQSALYAAAGAEVTVVDISSEMLALDRQVAAERGFAVRTLQASMDDLSSLGSAHFETVVQPVSTCYVPDVAAVYREVARVIVSGGLYVSQHKQPVNLQAAVKPGNLGYELNEPYYRSGPLPAVCGSPHREEGMLEFLHRWEDLIGGLCRSGFMVEDLVEPPHARVEAAPGSFQHRSWYVPPYVRIKARRRGPQESPANSAPVFAESD